MTETFAYVACVIFACLAVFQLALALGAPIGKFAWGGAHRVLPKKLRISSLVAIMLYGIFATVILEKADVTSITDNRLLVGILAWVITAYSFLGVLMNAVSKSKYERAIMTPVSLVLAVLFLMVSLS